MTKERRKVGRADRSKERTREERKDESREGRKVLFIWLFYALVIGQIICNCDVNIVITNGMEDEREFITCARVRGGGRMRARMQSVSTILHVKI